MTSGDFVHWLYDWLPLIGVSAGVLRWLIRPRYDRKLWQISIFCAIVWSIAGAVTGHVLYVLLIWVLAFVGLWIAESIKAFRRRRRQR